MSRAVFLFLVITLVFIVELQSQEEVFKFDYQGVTLDGVLNKTSHATPKGTVLIVHGSGRTDAVAKNYYQGIRSTLNNAGYHTLMWDKIGCGKSGGTFDYYQTIESSADEAIAAIHTLKKLGIRGSENIGLWGISRAGWVNPVIISKYKDIKFWISVSGVYARENFNYLLKENLQLDGLPKDSIDLLLNEWAEGNRVVHSGGSFAMAQEATKHLRKNSFMKRFNNNHEITKSEYEAFQKTFMKTAFDSATGQQINVDNFEELLSQVDCPVLAIFGEKDKNVDWRITKRLYEKTMGIKTDLTIKTFPNANHNLFICETGGFFEMQDSKLTYTRPEGYLNVISEWVNEID